MTRRVEWGTDFEWIEINWGERLSIRFESPWVGDFECLGESATLNLDRASVTWLRDEMSRWLASQETP